MRRSLRMVKIMQRAWTQQQQSSAATGGTAATAAAAPAATMMAAPRAAVVAAAARARSSPTAAAAASAALLPLAALRRRPPPVLLQYNPRRAFTSASASAAEPAPEDNDSAASGSSSSAAAEPRVRTRPRARRGSTGSARPSTPSEEVAASEDGGGGATTTTIAPSVRRSSSSRGSTTSAPPDGAANHRPKALRRRPSGAVDPADAAEEPAARSSRASRRTSSTTSSSRVAPPTAPAPSPPPIPPRPAAPSPPPLPPLSQAPLPAFAAEDSASYYGVDAAEHYYGEEGEDGMVGVAGEDAWLSSPSSLAPPPLPPPPQQQGQYRQGSSSAAPYYDPRAGGRRGGAPGGSSGGYYQQHQSSSAFGRSNGRRPPSRGADPDDPYGTPPPPPIAPKRVSEMTAEERVAMLVDKLREQGDIDVPEAQQRPGAHRLECPACGNGSAQEDCFAVTIRDDCALWCCHRSTCGYSGAVSVYGGYAPSEAPAGGGGGGGGGGNGGWGEEDADAAAADHIRQWRAQRAREEAGGANGGGVTAGRAGPSPSATSFALPGTAGVVSSGGARGAAADASSSPSTSASPIPIARPLVPRPDLRPLTPELLSWFAARGISPATLERNGVSSQRRWSQQHREEVDCVAFPYVRDGSVVNVKYRALPKAFSQTKGGEKVFYGFDDIQPAGGEGAEAGAASAAGGADAAANADPSSSSSSTRQWLDEPGDVIIVEGEMDKLSLEEAGFRRVVSVPDGAVARVKEGPLPAASEETKFSYLHSAWPALRAATRVLLATDNDGPGAALADELARRIGREKCWRVEWPTDRGDSLAEVGSSSGGGGSVVGAGAAAAAAAASSSFSSAASGDGQQQQKDQQQQEAQEGQGGSSEQQHQQHQQQHPPPETCRSPFFRKDANDVLVHDGPSALAAYVRRAQPLPIRGLFRFQAFWQQVHDLYKQGPGGLAWGASTGWPCVDPYYRVVPGELTIVTGVPNSGKSEWLDALLVNLARLHGWSFALCSMENRPADHARKLMEKYCGRPFYPPGVLLSAATNGSGGNKPTSSSSSSTPQRMTASELMESLVWVDERFHLIRSGDEELPSVEWVLERARAAVLRYGVRGLVIDPYNELDHRRPSHTSETEYVSQMLTRVKRFAQHYDCHVWFVAHPRQLQNWRGGAPSMYDISGSAHFINKADNGIVVHRPHAGLTAAGGVQGGGGGFGGGGGNGGGFGGGEAAMAAAAGPGAGDPFAVQLLVRKVRNKAAGRIGDALLRYDRATGTYADYDAFVSSSTSSSERSS